MTRMIPWFSALLLGLPSLALADTVVLAPLYGKAAGDMQVVNVTALIASELDFRPEFDDVVEITKAPSGSSCLSNPTCLSALAREGGGAKLVTGMLTATSSTFTLDMVYYDAKASKVLRTQQFTMSSEPEAVADGMTGVVKELLTGAPAADPAATKAAAVDEFDFEPSTASADDDFTFDDGPSPSALAAARKAEEERKAEAERIERERRAEEERKAEAERIEREEAERARRAEEERRRTEEAELARRAEEERLRRETERKRIEEEAAEAERRRDAEREAERKAAAVTEFDPSMITFGGSAADIRVESAATSRPAPAPAPKPTAPRIASDDEFTFDDLDGDADADAFPVASRGSRVTDLDLDLDEEDDLDLAPRPAPAPKPKPSTTASSRPSPRPAPKPTKAPAEGHKVQLTFRGGFAPFQTGTGSVDTAGNRVGGGLSFLTYGGEVAVPFPNSGLHFLAGVEGWSVNRVLTPELQQQTGRATWWNTIIPLNGGLVYKIETGSIAVPYAGADVIAALYYTDPQTSQGHWAVGPRARLGLDLQFTRAFGVTLGANVGVWTGKQWHRIEQGMRNAAVLPQIQGGTVFSF